MGPRGSVSPVALHAATTVTASSVSYRATYARSTDRRRPTSSATPANTAFGGAAAATCVATRRNAACSSATRRSASRASAFATAVASRSVNCAVAKLASGGQPFRIGRHDGQDAPEPALHSDRRADSASGAAAGEERGDRAGRALESLDAGGALRVMYLHDDTGACDVEA